MQNITSQNGHFCTSFHSVRERKTSLYVKNHNTIFTNVKISDDPVKKKEKGTHFMNEVPSGTPPQDRSTITGNHIYNMLCTKADKVNHSHHAKPAYCYLSKDNEYVQ